jgi:hypothetical protein
LDSGRLLRSLRALRDQISELEYMEEIEEIYDKLPDILWEIDNLIRKIKKSPVTIEDYSC